MCVFQTEPLRNKRKQKQLFPRALLLCEDGPVVIDHVDGPVEGQLLRLRIVVLEQAS